MFIATPLRLVFKLDKKRHTISTVERFPEPINLEGQIMCVVNDNQTRALNLLVECVVAEKAQAIINNHDTPDLRLSDFELYYSLNAVSDGRCWPGHGGVVAKVALSV